VKRFLAVDCVLTLLTSGLRYLRLLARCMYAGFLVQIGCVWFAKRQLRKRGTVITLAFHRVLSAHSFSRTNSLPGILMKEETFRDLLAHIKQHYQPVALENAIPGQQSEKINVVFTFDDGWRDNYTIVFPIARAYDIPFTIFVCPGVSGQTEPFWPEQACSLLRALGTNDREISATVEALKGLPRGERDRYLSSLREQALQAGMAPHPSTEDQVLSSGEILEMHRGGVSFGSHTQTHQILISLPMNLVEGELRQSKSAIEVLLGQPCTTLAYPNGDWSPEVRDLARHLGFRVGVTTQRGGWTKTCDRLAVPRSYMCEAGVAGLNGRFSAVMFEYKAFWLAWRAMRKLRSQVADETRIPHPTGLTNKVQA
jgi:peptidoglycan/xylan/chitin deacetylase (PgdA/CDA1 family)